MLAVKDVNQYYGGSHILRNVSLEVPAGKCMTLLGRNGVGKTTLLKAMMGLLPVRSGTIAFEGKSMNGLPPYARAALGLGYVPQGRDIFPRLTVGENLEMGRALAMRPKVLILDEPTEGIQPSIIKDIERAIRKLTSGGDMAILLVEQYYDFAKGLADHYVVLSRGEVIKSGHGADMDADGVRGYLTV